MWCSKCASLWVLRIAQQKPHTSLWLVNNVLWVCVFPVASAPCPWSRPTWASRRRRPSSASRSWTRSFTRRSWSTPGRTRWVTSSQTRPRAILLLREKKIYISALPVVSKCTVNYEYIWKWQKNLLYHILLLQHHLSNLCTLRALDKRNGGQ